MAENSKSEQVLALVGFLRSKRESILNYWRQVCEQDENLNSKASYSREEFNDQVPLLLNIIEKDLLDEPSENDLIQVANEHGLHRWQSGYDLHELIIEFELLFKILLDQTQQFIESNLDFEQQSVLKVNRKIFGAYSDSIRGSVTYYNKLKQTAAVEQAANLQNAVDQLEHLGQTRIEQLRHSSHDLRSSFSTLFLASQLLETPSSEENRAELVSMVNRNLSSIRELLLQLTDFSRIEAGLETLEIKEFDVSELLNSLIKTAAPLAENKNIVLEGQGPDQLVVSSDPVQIQRIFQNLIHNALKYTNVGGVYVSWAKENESRWLLSIQDTGQGFEINSTANLLAEQLKPAISTTAVHRENIMAEKPAPAGSEIVMNKHFKESEGLGIVIVKKICELMKATMDIESSPQKGTLIRIRFQLKQEPNKMVKSN
ncbi:sensor histidine kinase [Dyadobacter sp. CY356]|uniref:sensor histidine kinase n=1 Tax=Dyadobacter sp. CY356 TaxID=2906442 RepID=UPI001F37C48B|nr:sensor histidine kinase [Dyadobacter sp. CY356]MCF0055065.1 sensor histidine kinase [Dyadobacter sp. CY356]